MLYSAKNPDYVIKRMGVETLADMDALYQQVYDKKITTGFFAKKYDTAYTGVQYMGYIAYNANQQPIAYYGVVPCFIRHNGQNILSAQSADTMTHPQYRNKGLFVELAQLTYQLCRDAGIHVLFGFPNQNSLPGFVNKLNWQVAEKLDCFSITVKALPLEGLSKRSALFKGIYNWYTNLVLKRNLLPQMGITASVIKEGYCGVDRTSEYLENKTYNKTYVIRLGAAAIWLKTGNGLLIGDMDVAGDDFDHTMKQLKVLACTLGLKQIQFHVSRDTKLHTLFTQYAQAKHSFPVILKYMDRSPLPGGIKFTFADVDIF